MQATLTSHAKEPNTRQNSGIVQVSDILPSSEDRIDARACTEVFSVIAQSKSKEQKAEGWPLSRLCFSISCIDIIAFGRPLNSKNKNRGESIEFGVWSRWRRTGESACNGLSCASAHRWRMCNLGWYMISFSGAYVTRG